ncbi:MAG: hypothetical protein ACTIOD_12140 [Enterococcus faecalis]
MKASELLRRLTENPFQEEYKGIYAQVGITLVPLTKAKPDDEGNLFFHMNKKSPMNIKTFFAISQFHKNKSVFYWSNQKISFYSYRIDRGKIIV